MAKRKTKRSKKTPKIGTIRKWKKGGLRKKVGKNRWIKCNSKGQRIKPKK